MCSLRKKQYCYHEKIDVLVSECLHETDFGFAARIFKKFDLAILLLQSLPQFLNTKNKALHRQIMS